MQDVYDCKWHKITDDGDYDICLKKKFKVEWDVYDVFLRQCHDCKDHCEYSKKELCK